MKVNKQIISLSNRIEEAFKIKNMKQIDLVNKYDYLSSALINKFFNNQKTVTDILIRLCKDENINIDWLCTGRGNMFTNDEIFNTSNLLVNQNDLKNISSEFENDLLNNLKKLPQKKQEYYYLLIKADVLKEELDSK